MPATSASQANAVLSQLTGYPVSVRRPRGRWQKNKPGWVFVSMKGPSLDVEVHKDTDYLADRVKQHLLDYIQRHKDHLDKKTFIPSNTEVSQFFTNKYKYPFSVRRERGIGGRVIFGAGEVILILGAYQNGLSEDYQKWVEKNIAPKLEKMKKPILTTTTQIRDLTYKWADKIGVRDKIKSISFGQYQTRWGACTSTGNIKYNKWLLYMPPAIAESVVVHEVAHLVHMNHASEFQKLVHEMMPNYDELDRQLLEFEKNPFKAMQMGYRDGLKTVLQKRMS